MIICQSLLKKKKQNKTCSSINESDVDSEKASQPR